MPQSVSASARAHARRPWTSRRPWYFRRARCVLRSRGERIDDDAARRELHHVLLAGYIAFAEFVASLIQLGQHVEVARRLADEVRGLPAGPLELEALEALSELARVTLEVKRLCPILPVIFGQAPASGHRCPGEDYASCFIRIFLAVLLRSGVRWELPAQDMGYLWGLTPPEPRSGLVDRLT